MITVRNTFAAMAVALSGLVVLPSAARAEGPWYLNLSAGYLQFQDLDITDDGTKGTIEYEGGYAINAGVGYRVTKNLRAELELGYGSSSIDGFKTLGLSFPMNADVDMWSLTANVFYDFDTGSAFRPYVGLGAGVAHTEIGDAIVAGVPAPGDESDDFTMLGEVGASFDVRPGLALVPAYRYMHVFSSESDTDDSTAHVFKIGVRFDL